MTRKFNAQIIYKMKPTHPNYNDLPTGQWFRNRVLTYEDEYSIHLDVDDEAIMRYIKSDLKIVAGGGYNADHIDVVDFLIEEIK